MHVTATRVSYLDQYRNATFRCTFFCYFLTNGLGDTRVTLKCSPTSLSASRTVQSLVKLIRSSCSFPSMKLADENRFNSSGATIVPDGSRFSLLDPPLTQTNGHMAAEPHGQIFMPRDRLGRELESALDGNHDDWGEVYSRTSLYVSH